VGGNRNRDHKNGEIYLFRDNLQNLEKGFFSFIAKVRHGEKAIGQLFRAELPGQSGTGGKRRSDRERVFGGERIPKRDKGKTTN